MIRDQEWMRTYLRYDPHTGIFRWRIKRRGRPHGWMPAGTRAGSIWSTGYRMICIEGKRYTASRLAALWMTGRWPIHQMDHKNRKRSDDRWSNLREATPHQNQGNSFNSNNRLGLKGVCWEADRQKYKAYIEEDGRTINLGRFNTAAEAQAAYAAAARKQFGEFARTSA
jgi:hypothetical protein